MLYMKKKKKKKREHWQDRLLKVYALGLALILLLSSSWAADYIRAAYDDSDEFDLPGLVASVVLVLFSMWQLYRLRRRILSITATIEGDDPDPHEAGVFLVSLKWPLVSINDGTLFFKTNTGEHEVQLSRTLHEDIGKVGHDQLNFNWPWQQLLRAIAPHVSSMTRICLVGSAKDNRSDGSFADLELCRQLINIYLPDVDITVIGPVDFEDVMGVSRMVGKQLRKWVEDGIPSEGILVDITGGQKLATVGAAIATFYHQGVDFQYVSMDGIPTVYNLLSVSPINLSE